MKCKYTILPNTHAFLDVLYQTMKKKGALNNCSKNVDFKYIFLQFNSVDQEPSSRKWDDF